jgi:hypothetical protein
VPPPPGSGSRGTLAGERGVGRLQYSDEGTYTVVLLHISTLCSGQSDTSIGMVNMINIPVASPAIRDSM